MLQGDDFAFTNAVDPDEPRAYGTGIDRTRMLHKGFAIDIHAPHFDVEADINPRFEVRVIKNTGENGLMVLSKWRGFNGNMHLSNREVKSPGYDRCH